MSKSLHAMAREWARELGAKKFDGHESIVTEEIVAGFAEVERGRHPDAVLREVLKKIEDRIGCQSSVLTAVPTVDISSKLH